MSDKSKSTKSKSEDPVLNMVTESANALEKEQLDLRNKRDRRDKRYNLAVIGFNLILGTVSAVLGSWLAIPLLLMNVAWILIIWGFERQVSAQRYIINMMTGLRDIETRALEASRPKEAKGKK